MSGRTYIASQLKILLLGPYPPPHGGVETNVVAIRDFLLRHTISCEVINLTRHRKRSEAGIYYPRNALEVVRLLVRRKSVIIHLHIGGEVSWKLLGLGFVCSLLPGRKVVLTLHSGGYPCSDAGKGAKADSVRGFLFRRFDGLIGVNEQLIQMFQRFGVPREKARLILPFALPDRIPDVAFPDVVQRFIDTHRPLLLSVNGLESEYDLPFQIDALESLLLTVPDAGLLIFGKGSQEEQIQAHIEARRYADHILLAGDVSHEVVLRAMSLAHVLLRTTLYDGDSIAIREALHIGLPVIATDNGMRPPGARLIPVHDQAALLAALGSLMNKERPRSKPIAIEGDDRNLYALLEFYQELQQQ
jgi:glycogen synthase